MSTLKVNAISDAAGANGNAITLATDGTCTAKITNNLSNRNLIINGAMQVAERGTSSTATGMNTIDRWNAQFAGTDEAITQAQADVTADSDPWNKGFRKCLKLTNGNQTGGAGATDYSRIFYVIEAQDLAGSGWDYTSSSSYISYSFWIKSSVAQNFYGYLLTADGTNQRYAYETGTLSANTWTKVTKKIPGNSSITLNNDNGQGMYVFLWPFTGTDYTASGTALDTWAEFAAGTRTPDATSTWWTTNDATLELTGVQLEVGEVVTDFEHRLYVDELQRCRRYFQKLNTPKASGESELALGVYETGSVANSTFQLHPPMRATPTGSVGAGSGWYTIRSDGSNDNFDDFNLFDGTPQQCMFRATSGVSGSGGNAGLVRTQNPAAILTLSAEL